MEQERGAYTFNYPLSWLLSYVQNDCNLIGREECNIGRIVPSVSILYPLIKNYNIQTLRQENVEIYEFKTN